MASASASMCSSPPAASPASAPPDYDATLAVRRRHYGPNTSLSYERPLLFVRGAGPYLYDEAGVSYLDCVNNVSHLGHGHSEVAAAVSAQLHTLNTNSRYLHPQLPAYTRQLLDTLNSQRPAQPQPSQSPGSCSSNSGSSSGCGCCASRTGAISSSSSSSGSGSFGSGATSCSPRTCGSAPAASPAASLTPSSSTIAAPAPAPAPAPSGARGAGDPLEVLYLVCSGSEANDLALRVIGAARPGAAHIAVMGGAYHGHLTSLIPLSPYKFWGRGGGGKPPHVHVVPCPDPYRGEHLDGRAAARAVLAAAAAAGGRLGGFFAESVLSCGGQVVLPPGYLQGMYEVLRSEGVIVVADEVQCGFGRCGAAFWGFQTQGVLPDIVTMGKPIGNGYPLAALATTRPLAAAFASNGMEYFNTYGGSTAAVAAGAAVLGVLLRDNLQAHAQQVGQHLMASLKRLAADPALPGPAVEVLGDVRGLGLFIGVEIVRDRTSKRHAPVTAKWLKERLKARRVLLSTDGPYDNVIKIKPPLAFGQREADALVEQLRQVLATELTPGVRAALEAAEEAHWGAVGGPLMRRYRDNAAQLGLAAGPAAAAATVRDAAAAAAMAAVGQQQQQQSRAMAVAVVLSRL
ncbi:hypothetical protein HYH02_003708 [Chlamydomonas schloesseri]|uniref:Uncharacterized protein n=1 Tax=Chlamydomonas schloesseri TaxID=2026947 RepID=A0A835WPZ7_9CHLO|nr:hypothetical protein HYH02_003708 [Chlamydomonas schloesseri]|eukprot:KAG2451934.1 hypothetical protein HYH02_003708 [Chlamydomonas schloesseri]